MNLHVQLILDDEIEQFLRVRFKFFACGDVAEECWTQNSEVLSG